ncbi:MAG: Gfo/Idh/MocA family oxidoreductase [Gemmatimonadota bacterium]
MAIRTIHVGVGGRGAWPLRKMPARPEFEPVALVDINPVNMTKARETTGLPAEVCFTRMEDALTAVEADAVVVITPPDLHARQCLDAVRAGKHVLVEKPFTKSLAHARQIVDEAEQMGVKVAVCQNARYGAASATIHRLVSEGTYGLPSFGMMTKYGWRPGVHHSGMDLHAYLWERGIHDLDAMRYMLDALPRRTWGHSFNPSWSPYRGGGGAYGWVEFEGGATCGYMCTFAAHKGGSSFRLELEGGCLEETSQGLALRRPGSDEVEVVPLDEVPEPTDVLLDGFRDYVLKDVEPEFSGSNNLVTVAMVEAMGVASEEGWVIEFEEYLERASTG